MDQLIFLWHNSCTVSTFLYSGKEVYEHHQTHASGLYVKGVAMDIID